jgi:hypothetical protein
LRVFQFNFNFIIIIIIIIFLIFLDVVFRVLVVLLRKFAHLEAIQTWCNSERGMEAGVSDSVRFVGDDTFGSV